ncbi:DUF934 domain-containing protein [Palleronia sp. LCG004]|uniref:DUF934 domain-containing protein n=1 Tax=Palleronia sp. LCG004 TaxID=3079304 RepID=UPI002942D00B|nr:DUF934 domain-containing protein [Palleronia sp. LCG004]WOI57308.1 DUF934 domain-containing protein [Palleronia sp. LCG004]
MSVIVTDDGFRTDDWATGYAVAADWPSEGGTLALDLPSDADPTTLGDKLAAPMIRVDFPAFSDGRGFTIAAELRRMGYGGRLRAKGHVIADQYAMARRSGFDEVEIDDALALRQTEDQWLARADWRAHSYQDRLRG